MQRREELPWASASALGVVALILILGWFQLVPHESSVASDDGVYAVSAMAMAAGDSSVPHALADFDPEAVTHGYGASATDKGFFLSPSHLLWSTALVPGVVLADSAGLRAIPALALAVAVVMTFRLAVAAGQRDAALLASAAVVGSPLLFHGMQLWAHTAVAAAVAIAMVGALELVRGAHLLRFYVMVAGGSAVASALRGDGFIFVVALGIAIVTVGIRRSPLRSMALGGVVLVSSGVGYGGSAAYATAIVGEARDVAAMSAPSSSLRGIWEGFVQTVLSGTNGEPMSLVLLFVAIGCVAGACVALRRRWGAIATLLFLVATLAWFMRMQSYPRLPVTGLVAAWPIALLIAVRPLRRFAPGECLLGLTVMIGVTGVVMGQSTAGGGLNWGGRYLAAAVPPLAVLTASSLQWTAQHTRRASLVVPAVGVLVVALTAGMLTFDSEIRWRHHVFSHEVAAQQFEGPFITSSRHFATLDWASYPERRWLAVPEVEGGARRLRTMLLDAGIETVGVFRIDADALEVLTGQSFSHQRGGIAWGPGIVDIDQSRDEP